MVMSRIQILHLPHEEVNGDRVLLGTLCKSEKGQPEFNALRAMVALRWSLPFRHLVPVALLGIHVILNLVSTFIPQLMGSRLTLRSMWLLYRNAALLT